MIATFCDPTSSQRCMRQADTSYLEKQAAGVRTIIIFFAAIESAMSRVQL